MQPAMDTIRPIAWRDNTLFLLDQRELPQREIELGFNDVQSVAQAIHDMVVRGAPAIGITAAFAVVLAAQKHYRESAQKWRATIESDLKVLANARPTAVNLLWAIQQMRAQFDLIQGNPYDRLLLQAKLIHERDLSANYRMGEFGAELISSKSAVITHCNAGALATGGYGTALGVIRRGYELGKISRVYADETRPWFQGARLTAWELQKDGIPVTLMVDSAAAHTMGRGDIAWVIVGSDRIAANGDVANKIGTYQVAIAARYHNIKVMVVAPTSTIDLESKNGRVINIENRDSEEISHIKGTRVSAAGIDVINPAFDITPADLVDVIVTEKGVIKQPNSEKIQALMEKSD